MFGYVLNNPINIIDFNGLKPGDRFYSPGDAARDAIISINQDSISEDKEYSGGIYQDENGMYYASKPRGFGAHRSHPPKTVPNCVGGYHTHGAESGPDWNDEDFSPEDKAWSDTTGLPQWLGTPAGYVHKYP